MRTSKICVSIGMFIALTFFASVDAKMQPQQSQMNMQEMCQNMSPEMQQFAAKLTMHNKMLFCSKFNDHQRNQAMKMATQMNSYGKPMMTPDKCVEKVAAENNLTIPSSSQ